ncbi:WD40-repeat-containing domain protein [Sporodiniella umbellata]|nr:WD40-repeat-containing domain protein [Sporodiniella umbellata]
MEVHRCRFVEYQPAAINALDFTPASVKQSRLAVGRANGNIEIWDPRYNYRLEKTLPGGQDLSVESLVWAHQNVLTEIDEESTKEEIALELKELLDQPPRLFASGLNPYITEWDATTMTIKKSCDSNGGAVWCLAVNSQGTRLAAGCEDGCIRMFDIADGRLEYLRSFEPQRGRVLSVAWAPKDEFIVSGGSDSAIRTWNPETGRTIHRMTVDKNPKEQTLVWAVAATTANTIISGDSTGTVTFWDGKMGTMRQTMKAHGADILCMAVSKDGKQVFTAGVDRKINTFRRTTKKSQEAHVSQWINVGNRRYHWHDIRALALDERPQINSIVSGGVDVELVACPAVEFPKLIQNRLPPFPEKYIVSMSKSHQLVMASFFNSISVWKLGKAQNLDLASKRPALPEMIQPHQLALEVKLKADCNITSSALSENAQWIAVADVEQVRLFRVSQENETGQIQIKKQRAFERELNAYLNEQGASAGAHHVRFTPGSDKLIIVTVESRVLLIHLTHWTEEVYDILGDFGHHRGLDSEGNSSDGQNVATVVSIDISSDGQWLVTGDDENRIHVFNLDNYKHHLQLPQDTTPHTALSFNPFRPNELLVAQATNAFYIYNVEHKRLTAWSSAHQDMSHCRLLEQRDRIRGVAYNPAEQDKMVLYGSNYICLANIEHKHSKTPLGKRKQEEATPHPAAKKDDSLAFPISYNYQQVLYCDFLGENQMVVIERPKFSVLENLPPSFYKAQFGA